MPDGTLEPVRCGASNRCTYCAMFAAVEAALVVKLDAELNMPTVGLTTTTRDPAFTLDQLRKAEHALWRWLRKKKSGPQLKDVQYLGFLEWTTGQGTHAGGHRRPHLHHLVKGIPADHELLEPVPVLGRHGEPRTDPDGNPLLSTRLEQMVSAKWFEYTGDAWIVEVRPLRTPVGAIAYLTLHHHKREQAPPPGFTGRRLRPSKGYYERPIAELRTLARDLASYERVRMAARKTVAVEFFDAEPPDEYELEYELGEALMEALPGFRPSVATGQLDLAGRLDGSDLAVADKAAEQRQLVDRVADALDAIRRREPPELVRVAEREIVDEETGETFRRATAVLGPVEAWPKIIERGERPPPIETQLPIAYGMGKAA
jgi:hypothetical protein